MQRILNAQTLLAAGFATMGVIAALTAKAADRDIAEVFVKANGAEQRVEVDMNRLDEGQSRQLSADSGLPAIVTRTAEGLVVEIAGERHEIELPPIEVIHLGESERGKQVVIKRSTHRHSEGGADEREVRVIHHAIDGEIDPARIEVLVQEAMAEAEAARAAAEVARGQALEAAEEARKVRVIRRIERERSAEEGNARAE